MSGLPAAAPSAEAPKPAVRIECVKRGLWSTWEVEHLVDGAMTHVVPPVPAADASDESSLPCPQDVFVRACRGGVLELSRRCKALRLENCERTTVRALYGTVASVELMRCKGCVVEIHAPVSCVRVDDSSDITITLATPAAAAGFGADAEGAGATGFVVFSTSSHKVRMVVPSAAPLDNSNAEEEAPLRFTEHLLPETFHSVLQPGAGHLTHSVLSSASPWGARAAVASTAALQS